METPQAIRQQRVVGGNLALDMLNTQNGPAGGPPEDDVLHGYGDLLAWGHHVGMLSEAEADQLLRRSRRHPDAARATFDRAVATRGYLYELFDAIARGMPPPERTIARLQRDEAEALTHADLVPVDGGFAWSWAHDGDLARPLWPVIHAASTPADRWPARPSQGMRRVPIPLPRRKQEPEPTLVLDGRLRHGGQDAQVRGSSRLRSICRSSRRLIWLASTAQFSTRD